MVWLLLAISSVAPGKVPWKCTNPGAACTCTHLSLGREPGEVVVTWQSPVADTASTLNYGHSPASISTEVTASSSLLPNGVAGAWRNVSVHSASIRGVRHGSTVFYSVSDEHPKRVLNFTATAPHGVPGPTTFAIFGDLGVKEQEGANWTLARLKDTLSTPGSGFDVVLHVGDMAYDLPDDSGRTGDEFLSDLEPIASYIPYMTCPGNHERDCPPSHDEKCSKPPYTNYRRYIPPAYLPPTHRAAVETARGVQSVLTRMGSHQTLLNANTPSDRVDEGITADALVLRRGVRPRYRSQHRRVAHRRPLGAAGSHRRAAHLA